MNVGVQRLALVTPAERIEEELAVHASPVTGNDDNIEITEVGMEGEDEEDICNDEKQVPSRELKSLEVPA